jgi:putative transcriptional regulator
MNNIKIVLKQQGRSQAWLAENIGKSYVVTTNYCNNKTQPSLATLYRIAAVLEIDVKDLVGIVENNLNPR